MKKQFILIIISVLLGTSSVVAQKFSISGTVVNEKQEELVGVNVYLRHTRLGSTTNANGEFVINKIEKGSYILTCSAVGMETLRKSIELSGDITDLRIQMKEGNEKLEAVVVTGTGTRHKLSEAPVQTEVIGKKTIRQLAPQRVEDLLMQVSPSFEFTPNSMGSNMSLNGLNNKYVLVMIDGKRLHGDVGGNNDLNRINPEDIERIEVVKGASSSLYGSEAVGGVVNIITKRSKNQVNITNSSQFQELGQWQQSNSIGINAGKFSLTSRFGRKRNEGWQLSEFELDKKDELVATSKMAQNAYTDYTFSQSVQYEPNAKLNLDAFVSHYKKDVERPTNEYDYGYYFEDLSYNFGGSYKLSKKASLKFDFNSDNFKYFYRYNKNDEKNEFYNGDLSINKDQTRYEGNLISVIKLKDWNILNTGFQYVDEAMVSDRLISDRKSASTVSAYVQDEIKFLKHYTLVAGMRFNSHETFG